MHWSRRLFRILLLAYPKRIRQERGDDMWLTFERHLRDARRAGRLAVLDLWRREVIALWRGGRRTRISVRERRPADRRPDGSERTKRFPAFGMSWLDFKLGFRMLVKQPGLTLVAVFALSIGIPVGLVPAHFVSALQAPLPFDEGDRILVLRNFNVAASREETPSLYDFMQWRDELTTFAAFGAAKRGGYNVNAEDGRAEPVRGAEVTASTFDILRVRPLFGRALISADEVIGAPAVVVIGYDLWQARLGGEPDIVGRAIRIGRVPHTVVGVMPKEFLFPSRDQLWLPLRVNALADEHRLGREYTMFGRLSDGISSEEAQAELTTIGLRMGVEFPDTHTWLQPEMVPFAIGFFSLPKGGFQSMPEFYLVQVLTLLLLVVACANVGMLILARTASRSSELAVRTALGASRARIVSQLFTEALVFAVLAAGVGLLLADRISVRFDWMENLLPFWVDLGVAPTTVLKALLLAVFSAGAVSIIPALKVTGKAVQRSMQRAAAGRAGVRFGGMSSALVVADVMLAVATVGLAVGLWDGLTEARDGMGIQADRFLSAQLRVPRIEPADGAAFNRTEFMARVGATQRELVRRLAAEPGIRGVAVGSVLPGMDHPGRRVELDGENRSDDSENRWVVYARVDVDFFNALEQPILVGRGFELSDLGEGRSVVIANTTFVDRMLEGRNPIGRRVRYKARADEEPDPWYEIVGVVGSLGMNVEALPGRDAGLYHPVAPGEINPLRLAIHVGDDPASFTPRLRALASEVDPTATVSDPVALDEVFSFNTVTMDWVKIGAGTLIGILVGLSVSGIYALMSFTVAQRTRELGIRAALGAQKNNIVFTIARRALAQLGIGALLGMPIAGWLLFELRSVGRTPMHSPFAVMFLVGASVMVLIGGLACTGPTLRALRIKPTEALREGG